MINTYLQDMEIDPPQAGLEKRDDEENWGLGFWGEGCEKEQIWKVFERQKVKKTG